MSKTTQPKNYWYHFIGAAITVVAYLGLRFYNLADRIAFAWDQNRDAQQISDIIKQQDLTLIGPRVVGPEGFFLAPYYTYLLVPFYALTSLSPSALMVLIVCYNLIFLSIAFFVIRTMRSVWHALVFLLFWGINALLIGYDIIPWNPLLIPLGVIGVWYLLWRVYHRRHLRDWLLLGLTCGIFFHFHFQFVFIYAFVGIMLYYTRTTIAVTRQKIFVLFAGLVIPFAPLVLFDLRHSFMNTKLALTFFHGAGLSSQRDFLGWTEVIGNALQPFTVISHPLLGLIAYGGFCTGAYFLFRRSTGFYRPFYRAALFLFMLVPIAFLIYGKRPSEYHIVSLFPFFIFIIVESLNTWGNRPYIRLLAVLYLLIASAVQYPRILEDQPYGLSAKTKATEMIRWNHSQDELPVRIVAPLGLEAGFPYLLEYHNLEMTTDHATDAIEIHYRQEGEKLDDQYQPVTEYLYLKKPVQQ